MSLSDRLKAARANAGLSQAALARAVGLTQQAVAALERADTASSRRLAEIARALNVSIDWLAFGEGSPTPVYTPAPDDGASDYTDVIGYSQAVGLGAGAEAMEYAETHSLKFKKSSLRRRGILNRPLAVYYGKGDSMEPTIKDGDAILFDTSDQRVVDGELYVVQMEGSANPEIYVKRALVLDGGVYFASDNPQGDHNWRKPRAADSRRSPITVIGRVHWIGGWAS